jgi:hypothetical protein
MEPQDTSRAEFDQLCLLRQCYQLRGPYDRRSDLTVDEAIRLAERLLRLTAAMQRPWRSHDVRHRAA